MRKIIDGKIYTTDEKYSVKIATYETKCYKVGHQFYNIESLYLTINKLEYFKTTGFSLGEEIEVLKSEQACRWLMKCNFLNAVEKYFPEKIIYQ